MIIFKQWDYSAVNCVVSEQDRTGSVTLPSSWMFQVNTTDVC